MSFLKKLFGGGGSGSVAPVAEADYQGFKIKATPMEEGGQYRVCAHIYKDIEGTLHEHKLVRADICGSQNEAADLAMRKARQIIDERGDKVFN